MLISLLELSHIIRNPSAYKLDLDAVEAAWRTPWILYVS